MDMKQEHYQRVRRRMPDEVKRRISDRLRGRKLDPQTKEAISQGLKRYWSNVVWEDDK